MKMKLKKMMAFLTVFLMAFQMMPVPALAGGPEDNAGQPLLNATKDGGANAVKKYTVKVDVDQNTIFTSGVLKDQYYYILTVYNNTVTSYARIDSSRERIGFLNGRTGGEISTFDYIPTDYIPTFWVAKAKQEIKESTDALNYNMGYYFSQVEKTSSTVIDTIFFQWDSVPKQTKNGNGVITFYLTPYSEPTGNEPGNDQEPDSQSNQNEPVLSVMGSAPNETNNLNEFITDAVLSTGEGTFGKNDIWNVVPDANYGLKLSFAEKGTRQFPQSGETISMTIPSGLNIPDGTTGTFDIPAGLAGTITGNTYRVQDGKIYITFGEDPEDIMTRSSNVHFDISFNASISSDATEIHFNDRVHPEVKIDHSSEVDASKSAYYNPETGKMEYTVTVKSKGKSENVRISDVLANNNLLTFDSGSITIEPSSRTYTDLEQSSTGFSMNLGAMTHDETVTIKYTASVNYSALSHNGTIQQQEDGSNTVTATNDDHYTDTDTNVYTNQIKYSNTSKTNTSVTDGESSATLDWKITLNDNYLGSIVGDTITDTIDWNSKDGMKYADPLVLTIKARNQDGTIAHTKEVTIGQSAIGNNNGQQSWSYQIEQFDSENEILSYEITYQTVVDKTSQDIINAGGFVKNNTNNEGDGSATGTGVVPGVNGGSTPGEETITGGKKATNVTTEYTDWDIVVVIPPEGFPNDFTVVDDIPYLQDYGFSDSFDKILSIEGLTANETWESSVEKVAGVSSLTGKTRDILTIQFYQDQNKINKGLEATQNARTLTIKIRTKNSEEWITSAEEFSGGDPRYIHTNTAKVNNFAPFTAQAIPLHSKIEKTSSRDLGNIAIQGDDGQWSTIYGIEYKLVLSNVSEEPITITDTYDSSVLEFYGPGANDHKYIAAVSSKNNLNNGIYPYMASFDASTDGTITITADHLPKKEDGSFYEYYGIYYVLQVKDADTLARKAIENGGMYKIGNDVEWNGAEDHFDYDYEEPILTKNGKFVNDAWDSKDRKYDFNIEINPQGKKLLAEGEGNTLDLTDTHTANLSVDYSTVKVYKYINETKTEDNSIQWNFNGNVGSFYDLLDETHYTIEYRCLVTGIDNQEFSNEAEMNGFHASKSDRRDFGHDASGGADVYQISLVKYKNGATSERLPGATFQLFQDDGNGNPQRMTYGDTAKTRERGVVGKNITFTTNENGFVRIALNQTNDGAELKEGVHYYLKEIESPPGYQIDSSVEYWSFTLTSDASQVNYGGRDENGIRQWIYFSYDDILKMNNTPTTEPITVQVDKQWLNADGTAMDSAMTENLIAKVQLKQKKNTGEYLPVKVTREGETVTVTTVTDESGLVELNKANNWTYTWDNLPRVSGDDKYAYIIEEVSVDGYAVSMTSRETEDKKTYTLKNFKIPEDTVTSITVQKEWQDYEGNVVNNPNVPDTIDFFLYQVVSSEPFTEVPQNGGELYVIPGDGRLKNVSATSDDDDYGIWQLKKSENLTTTFNQLPSMGMVGGKTVFYTYYVRELPMSGYTVSYLNNGTFRTIVNQSQPPEGEYIDLVLLKKWVYGDSTTPPEGSSATFKVHQLKASPAGSVTIRCGEKAIKANKGDTITVSYATTPYHYLIVYEDNSNQFSTQADGTGVGTFTYTVSKDSDITLSFGDSSIAATGMVNANMSYSDYAEVTAYDKTISLPTNQGAWRTTVKNLVTLDAEGNKYKYYITEESKKPDTAQVTFTGACTKETATDTNKDTATFTNTVERKGSLELTKTTVAYPSNSVPSIAIKVTPPSGVQLEKDTFSLGTDLTLNTETNRYELTEEAKNKLKDIPVGKYTITEIALDSEGYSYDATYTIDSGAEKSVSSNGIEATVSAGETTQIHLKNIRRKSVSATKAWLNPDGSTNPPAGASVVFTLYADGSRTDRSVTLNGVRDKNGETSPWVATFDDLDIYQTDGTTEIVYTIVETTQYAGYSPNQSSVSGGGTITNSATKLGGTKIWDEDPEGTTHNYQNEVLLTLYRQASGKETETVSAVPVWTNNKYEYNPLPKYNAEGNEYTYWVVESRVDGYLSPVYGNSDPNSNENGKALDGGTITNKKIAKGILILTKTDNATGTKKPLQGAKFDLYKQAGTSPGTSDERIQTGLTTDVNGKITITEVEPGTYYFIETQAPEGYVLPENESDRRTESKTIIENASVVTQTITKTNTEEEKASLTIMKHVTGNACDKNDEFTVNVTLYDVKLVKASTNSDPDQATEYQIGDKFVSAPGQTFELALTVKDDNNGATIQNIPVGTKYKIVENPNTLGYILEGATNDSPDGTVAIPKDGITATFTNRKDLYGKLKITKTLGGNALPETPKSFTFKVTLTPPEGSLPTGQTVKYGNVTYTVDTTNNNVYAAVYVTGGQTIMLDGIPNGWSYLVQEINGTAALTLNSKDSDGYELTESSCVTGMITGIPNGDTTITIPEASFKNVKNETGSFRITKELAGNNPDATTSSFNVTVTVTDEKGDTLTGTPKFLVNGTETDFEAGTAIVSIPGNGNAVTISGIPNGYHYSITESAEYSNNQGYDTPQYRIGEDAASTTAPSGTIHYMKDPLYTIINTRNTYGSLEINKSIQGNAANKEKSFSFTITFTDQNDQPVDLTDTAYEIQYSGTNASGRVVNGNTITVSLSDEETFKAEHLPVGWKYTVTEDDYSDDSYVTTLAKNGGESTASRIVTGSITSVATGPSTAPTGSTETVTYTNTKNDYGKLSIKKISSGNSKNPNDEFTVKVTLNPVPATNVFVDGNEQTVTDAGISITIKDGETKEIDGIPNGTVYTVEETVANGYMVSYGALGTADNKDIADEDATETTFTGRIDVNGETYKDNENKGIKIRNAGVQVNNVLDKFGELDLTKIVAGEDNSASVFHFEVKLPSSGFAGGTIAVYEGNTAVTAEEGTSGQFENGIAQVYLKDQQTAKMTGLPAGATYEVAEILADGQEYSKSVTVGSASGSIAADDTIAVTVTNTKLKYGDLLICKNVTGNAASLTDMFTFTVKLKDTGNNAAYELATPLPAGLAATETKGTYTATVSANSSLLIEHILVGTHYEVTENSTGTSSSGYILESDAQQTGMIKQDEISTAAFTNRKNLYGAFTLKKTTAGNDPDKKTWFAFKVTLKDKDGKPLTGTFGDLSFDKDGVAAEKIAEKVDRNKYQDKDKQPPYNVVITKEDTITVYGIPNGAVYTVEEAAVGSYVVSTNGNETGTIVGYVSEADKDNQANYTTQANAPVSVEFTNTRNYFGKLKVLKQIEGNAASLNDPFDIYVKILEKNAEGNYTEATGRYPLGDEQGTAGWISPETTGDQAGLYKITLNGGESRTIYKIPKWTKVVVSEPDIGGYDNSDIKYYINYGISGKEDESQNQKELTAEATYRSVTIEEKMITAVVTNTKNRYGNLKISKTTTGNATDPDDLFTFTVHLSGTGVTDGYNVYKTINGAATSERKTLSSDDNLTVQLKAGETAEIRGLANGIAYEITESTAATRGSDTITGYTQTTATNSRGTIDGGYPSVAAAEAAGAVNGQPITVAFTNHRDTEGSLQIVKTLSGNDTDSNKLFTFTIKLGESTDNPKISKTFAASGAYESITFTEGIATVRLNGGTGNTVTITGLPNGIKYTVTETVESGYTPTVVAEGTTGTAGSAGNTVTGTIAGHSTKKVTIDNERNTYGNLEISKNVAGNAADPDKPFKFTITLSDTGFTGGSITTPANSGSNTSFTKGVAIVYLKDGEKATASDLPNGCTYTVAEADYSETGYLATYSGNTGTIIGNETQKAAFTNTRNATGKLKIKKIITGTGADLAKDFMIRITLPNNKTLNETIDGVEFRNGVGIITLNGSTNCEKEIDGLPNATAYKVEEVYEDNGTWKTISRTGNDGYTVAYDSNAEGTISETQPAETAVTNTYTRTGSVQPEVIKKVTGETGQMTEEQKKESFTFVLVADPANPSTEELPSTLEISTSGDATVADGIKVTFDKITYHEKGTYWYTIREKSGKTPGMSYDINTRHVKVVVDVDPKDNMKFATTVTYGISKAECNQTKLLVINQYTKPTKPIFEKKIQDINDSNGVASEWQDSADYDIGDEIPYRLTATLANNVAEYSSYHITFHDTMDKSLDFAGITEVKIGDTPVATYTLSEASDHHSFDLKLEWTDSNNEKIANAALNNAVVTVYYKARLNNNAKLGKTGNVNACYLEYSNNPNSNSVDTTQKDAVIAFTYELDISKVDEFGRSLSGASFKLQKSVKNGDTIYLKDVAEIAKPNGNQFSFKGLDDGDYILTETVIPDGCKAIAPIRFSVSAGHAEIWDVAADTNLSLDRLPGRTNALNELTGNVTTGELTLTASNTYTLTGSLKNKKASKPEFNKKIKDTNDTSGETSDWVDSADYDIGDAVPYRLYARLADNVTDYKAYHITFHDTMDASLDFKELNAVCVGDALINSNGYTLTVGQDKHSFDLTITWNGQNDSTITDTSLNSAIVTVYFEAELNQNANIGSKGNVNACYLEYSNNPSSNSIGVTQKDAVIAFTYEVDLSKVDQNNQALNGAEFKLEKKMADGTLKAIATISLPDSNVFAFKGLDDGDYVLTETNTPNGYKAIDPIEFTVAAAHNEMWEVSADIDTALDQLPDRERVLTGLTGTVTTGKLTLNTTADMSAVTGKVENIPILVNAAVHKVWKDGENRDGKRPLTLTVRLLVNGQVYSTETLTAANNWTLMKKGLPKVDAAGNDIIYNWQEATPAGYTLESTITDGILTTLTNVYTPEKTSASVRKVWDDREDIAELRPDFIEVQLFADGKAEGDLVTLSEANGWAYEWNDLDKNRGGKTITYTVEETEVPEGYTMSVRETSPNDFVITNKITFGRLVIEKRFRTETKPEYWDTQIEIPVNKIWDDFNNRDGNRPESITIRLYADGVQTATARITEADGWTYTFQELPKYNHNREIRYTISEDPVELYRAEIHEYTVINRYNPPLMSVSVRKVWDDNDNEIPIRPKSIRMTLNNGTSVLLNAANGWSATVSDLPAIVNGEPAQYVWIEQEVPGYRQTGKSVNGEVTTFTNKVVKLVKVPLDQPQPKVPGAIWFIFEEYDTALGGEILINHVGDCFD